MMCQRIGLSPIGIIGFGIRAEVSPIRRPRPPQKMTTFMSAAASSRPLQDLRLRNRYDELPAPFPDVRELCGDLPLQVPRQDQDVVRPGLRDALRGIDRDVGAGQEPPVLVRIAVDGVVEEIGPDAAVVQQGVALPGRAVADDLLALRA